MRSRKHQQTFYYTSFHYGSPQKWWTTTTFKTENSPYQSCQSRPEIKVRIFFGLLRDVFLCWFRTLASLLPCPKPSEPVPRSLCPGRKLLRPEEEFGDLWPEPERLRSSASDLLIVEPLALPQLSHTSKRQRKICIMRGLQSIRYVYFTVLYCTVQPSCQNVDCAVRQWNLTNQYH